MATGKRFVGARICLVAALLCKSFGKAQDVLSAWL